MNPFERVTRALKAMSRSDEVLRIDEKRSSSFCFRRLLEFDDDVANAACDFKDDVLIRFEAWRSNTGFLFEKSGRWEKVPGRKRALCRLQLFVLGNESGLPNDFSVFNHQSLSIVGILILDVGIHRIKVLDRQFLFPSPGQEVLVKTCPEHLLLHCDLDDE